MIKYFIVIINIFEFYLLFFGFFHSENYYQMQGYDILQEYLNYLIKFYFFLFFLFIFKCILTYKYFTKYKDFMILKFLSFINFFISTYFLFINIYRNYFDNFELNIFVFLIEKYGFIINFLYIIPLLLAIFYTVFLIRQNKLLFHKL